jgi:hypothetical protein
MASAGSVSGTRGASSSQLLASSVIGSVIAQFVIIPKEKVKGRKIGVT